MNTNNERENELTELRETLAVLQRGNFSKATSDRLIASVTKRINDLTAKP